MIELEITKISRYKGKPISMYYKIRAKEGTRGNYVDESYEWQHGSIRLDLTSMYSAALRTRFTLKLNVDGRYEFERGVYGTYQVLDELIEAANRVTTEYYLLGKTTITGGLSEQESETSIGEEQTAESAGK